MSSTLPEAPFPLIGREGDLTLAQALLLRAETRLLTLTGPPGVGKTRLAIEIARQFASASAHGTAFVDLTPIRDPAQFWPAIAQALGVAVRDPATIADRLVAVLRDRPLLLLLDNFEHLAAAASAVARIVEECPGLKILATSREPLHLSWEREFPVKPLPVPDLTRLPEPADLTAFPAVALFVARGQRIDPQFAVTPQNAGAVAELCVRLSGLPLAIELAAARLKVLSPQAMVREVGPRLQFLERITGDLPARHHTMRGAIGWSYQLLSAAEQSLFRSVAVFRGGWTLDAAAAVWSAGDPTALLNTMSSLVDKSLILREVTGSGEPRFAMLEVIREFAYEQLLAAGELEAVRDRQAGYALSLVEQAAPHLSGAQQSHWLDRLARDYANIRDALEFLRAQGGAGERLIRFVAALWRFWNVRGYWAEGWQWAETALAAPELTAHPQRGQVLHGAGVLAWRLGNRAQAAQLAEEAVAVCRGSGDLLTAAHALRTLSVVARDRHEMVRARELGAESLALFRGLGDQQGVSTALRLLGLIDIQRGEFDDAVEPFRESLTLSTALGDERGMAWSTYGLAAVALGKRDLERAVAYGEASLGLFRNLGDKNGVAQTLVHFGRIAAARGDVAAARRYYEEGLAIRRELGDLEEVAATLRELAAVVETGPAVADRRALSARELEVAALVADGRSNRAIAQALFISERTVQSHVQHILDKLGFRTRSQIAAWFASRHGLPEPIPHTRPR